MGDNNLARIMNVEPIRKDPEFKDGDSDGPDNLELINISIDIAENGYVVQYNYDDGTEEKFVHTDFDEVLKQLRTKH